MSEAMATRMSSSVQSDRCAGLRLPIAIVTALVVAEAAVVLMRPRDRGPDPLPVQARALLHAGADRARRGVPHGQLWLGLGQMAIGLAALALLVRHPPRRVMAIPPAGARRRGHRGDRRGRRRPRAAAAARSSPASAPRTSASSTQELGRLCRRRREVRGDPAVFAGAGGALLVLAMRRFGRRWWIPGTVAVVAFARDLRVRRPRRPRPAVQQVHAAAAAGELRDRACSTSRGAPASTSARSTRWTPRGARRPPTPTSTGSGRPSASCSSTRCSKDFTPAETAARRRPRARPRPLPRRAATGSCTWPSSRRSGMLAAAALAERPRAARRAARAAGDPRRGALARPAAAADHLDLEPALARRRARAPTPSRSQLTGDPRPLIGFQRRIAVQNVADPDPPGWRSSSCSARTRRRCSGSAGRGVRSGAATATSGRLLIPSRVLPLRPVVLHRVDQLAHEARREVDAGDDDAGDLARPRPRGRRART